MNFLIYLAASSLILLIAMLCHARGYSSGYLDGEHKAQEEATRRSKRDMVPLFWSRN